MSRIASITRAALRVGQERRVLAGDVRVPRRCCTAPGRPASRAAWKYATWPSWIGSKPPSTRATCPRSARELARGDQHGAGVRSRTAPASSPGSARAARSTRNGLGPRRSFAAWIACRCAGLPPSCGASASVGVAAEHAHVGEPAVGAHQGAGVLDDPRLGLEVVRHGHVRAGPDHRLGVDHQRMPVADVRPVERHQWRNRSQLRDGAGEPGAGLGLGRAGSRCDRA